MLWNNARKWPCHKLTVFILVRLFLGCMLRTHKFAIWMSLCTGRMYNDASRLYVLITHVHITCKIVVGLWPGQLDYLEDWGHHLRGGRHMIHGDAQQSLTTSLITLMTLCCFYKDVHFQQHDPSACESTNSTSPVTHTLSCMSAISSVSLPAVWWVNKTICACQWTLDSVSCGYELLCVSGPWYSALTSHFSLP